MSFTNNVYGGVPQSEMVFSTSNISSDNASFINLSVSGYATITNLTTVNWSQPNLNASTIVTDALVVTNTSAVNLDVSGVMNVSDLNISDLNVSDISVSTLNVGDIVIDEAEVTTLRFDDVTNANYSEIQRDNDTLTIAGGYANAQGTQFNGDIAFTPYNLSNANAPSMVVQASDGKVYIPNMSALDINTSSLQAIDITASTTIVAPTMNTSTLNVSTINVDTDIDVPDINTSQINASNISVDVDLHVTGTTQTDILEADTIAAGCDMTGTLETSTDMYYPNNLLIDFSATQNATTIELSSNLSLNGIDLLPDLVTAADPTLSMLSGTAQITNANISTLTCDLTPNLTAGTGITITSVGGIPTIASTGYVTDPLNVSQLNASNISIDADLSVTGTATITDADITTLTCDLTPNLTAGTGITITSVGGKPTISSTTVITDPLNLSTLNASQVNASYAYVRWDINVSNTVYATANVDAGNSIFANANMVAGGSVTSTGYNFKRTVADGGLTMANMFANANSLDLSMSYDWNIYKSNNTGVRMMQFDFSAGNVNMSNASINNLSVLSIITTPDATITDLTIPGTISIPGILNHDFSKNVTAGAGINITHVGNQMTIAATGGGGVTDPLNLSTLNASQANASNISVGTIQPGLINASVTNTEFLNVSGSAAQLVDGLTVYGQTAVQNISTANISSSAFITAVGDIRAGGGIKATGGSGLFSTGVIHLNNANDGTGDTLEMYYTGTQFGMGTVSGKDFTINAGYNTGGLVIDGTLNNVNMSNCSITNLSLDTLTCDLTPNLTAGTGITITSVGGKPTITATGGGGVTDPLNLSQLNASNISVDENVSITGRLAVGGVDFRHEGTNNLISYLDVNSPSMKWYLNKTMDFRKDDDTGIIFMKLNHALENVNISNLSTTNVSSTKIDVTNLSVDTGITTTTLAATGNILTEDSFTFRTDSFTAFTITNSTTPTEYRLTTTSNNQDIRICNATGAGGLLFDAGNNDINISQFNASNIDVDANITTDTLTCDLTPNLTAGTGITITSVGGKPTITASGGGGVTDPLNISQLNASNISVDLDVTIGQDLQVQRYLDRGKPRFIMLYRSSGLALTGTAQAAVFNANTTAQIGGEFGVANGSDVQVSTGGWYRVSFALGFVRTQGNRLTVRPSTRTRTNAGSFNYESSKDIYGASCYMRSASLNREGYTTGTVLRYIPSSGWVQIRIEAMVEGAASFSSSFNGTNLRNESNFMVEFVSSAAET